MSAWLVPLLLPPLGLTGSFQQDGPADPVLAELEEERAVVARVLIVNVEEDAEDQQRAYESIQPAPLVSFVDLLAEGRVPSAWADELDEDLPLEAETRAALHRAFAKVRIAELRPFFETLAADDPRLDRREVCLTILAEVGERRDLELVLGLATPLDEKVRVLPRSLRKSYEDAVRSIIERDGSSLAALRGTFDDMHPGLLSASVDAIAGVQSRDALATLIAMLGRVRGLDAYALAAIARVGAEVPRPLPDEQLSRVRGLLSHADRNVLQAAVRAVGRLGDYEAIPTLLAMLSQPDDNLRTSAHVALKDITGLKFRPDSRLWNAWYDRETEWWELDSAAVFIDLSSRDELRVSDAINRLSGRHLYRHQLAAALLPVLQRSESGLVVMACQGLGQIRSRTALDQLVGCLEHPDWSVRRAAWTALVKITGREWPPEMEAWEAEIEAQGP